MTKPRTIHQAPSSNSPAKLRNAIYALICAGSDEHAYLHTRSRGNLAHGSSLLRVNRQDRNEFMAVLCTTVPSIQAHVKDFDFAHIITFFNRCDEIELKSLKRAEGTSGDKRTMSITLDVEPKVHYFFDRLRRWVNRSASPEKKGTDIEVCYRLRSYEHGAARDLAFVVARLMEVTGHDRKMQVFEQVSTALDPSKSFVYLDGHF